MGFWSILQICKITKFNSHNNSFKVAPEILTYGVEKKLFWHVHEKRPFLTKSLQTGCCLLGRAPTSMCHVVLLSVCHQQKNLQKFLVWACKMGILRGLFVVFWKKKSNLHLLGPTESPKMTQNRPKTANDIYLRIGSKDFF